jgi:hypothetical protein
VDATSLESEGGELSCEELARAAVE